VDNVIEVSVVQEMECYRRYLGDNVYANFDGQRILLWQENGCGNSVVISGNTAVELANYIAELERLHVSQTQEDTMGEFPAAIAKR
jgi:hypothetical protein